MIRTRLQVMTASRPRPALKACAPAAAVLGAALTCLQGGARAADDPESYAVHGQFTYTEQQTSGFNAPYAGPNSLSPHANEETVDATLFLGHRLWSGAEIWIGPEIDQGFGLDDTLGVAGFPSGEAYKVGENHPYVRLQRIFVRQTLNLDQRREWVDPTQLQLGGTRSPDRLVLTVGKISVTDIFDNNQYAHDPKNDFLNWAAIDTGSFDYAADAWGYTAGAALEWYRNVWALRFGVFDLSNVPNSIHLEPGFHEFQYDFEVERSFEIGGRPGKLRLTAFDSRARMGLLNQAVDLAASTDTPVKIAAVRSYRDRLEAGLDLEQQLAADLGMFARIGKAAGNVEAYDFTDIDRSVSTGLSLQGARWGRHEDTVGLAAILNRISADRERYLNAGGLGILIGDGKLPFPGPEKILETYYSIAVLPFAQLTFDYQYVGNPAYNTQRGPVSVFAVRIHAQF
jgi:high affinity Mn2+ porin